MSTSEIARCVRTGQPIGHVPVIDFHCHLGASSDYYYVPKSEPAQVVRCMDRFGIDHIVTFTIGITSDAATGNRLQYAAAQAHPRRVSALTLLHAQFPQDWLGLLEEGQRHGSRGIKLISQYQKANEETIDWSPAFDYARPFHWVVLHHSWGSPDRLDRWARSYPELTFIVGHATTAYQRVIESHSNVYQCTCACFVAGAFSSVRDMVAELPIERIVYGSDALDLDFGTGIAPIALADIPEASKEAILGGNAMELVGRLGWDVDTQAYSGTRTKSTCAADTGSRVS